MHPTSKVTLLNLSHFQTNGSYILFCFLAAGTFPPIPGGDADTSGVKIGVLESPTGQHWETDTGLSHALSYTSST